MPRLFWKIFGWFWGAMILIGLALYTVVLTTRPDPMPLEWRHNTASALRVTAALMVSQWESGGAAALRAARRNAQRGETVRFWLLDGQGERLINNRNAADEREETPGQSAPGQSAPNSRVEARPTRSGGRDNRSGGRDNRGASDLGFEGARFFSPDGIAEMRARGRQARRASGRQRQTGFRHFRRARRRRAPRNEPVRDKLYFGRRLAAPRIWPARRCGAHSARRRRRRAAAFRFGLLGFGALPDGAFNYAARRDAAVGGGRFGRAHRREPEPPPR